MTEHRLADRAFILLALAATPAFSIMALITAVAGGGFAVISGLEAHSASPLNGMTVMYLLMSTIHAAPWVRLCSNRLGC